MIMLIWFSLAFISGAVPYSVWVGRWRIGLDIRTVGDGNPGTANVFRAGGGGWGVLVLILDFLKGALPVLLASHWGSLAGWELAAVAAAPVLGHAYSPFLGLRGGKALTVSFGSWTGLTLWRAPVVLGLGLTVGLFLLAASGWAVIFGLAVLLGYFVLSRTAGYLFVFWAFNSLLLVWKYRADLSQPPTLRKRPPEARA